MVKIYRDADNRINMTVTQEELHTLVAYMGVGVNAEAQNFAHKHCFSIPSFIEQTPLYEGMLNYVKMEHDKYED